MTGGRATAPALLTKRSRRSGRDEGGRDRFVLVVRRVRSGFSVAMPFEEEDESPFVGLLQVEAV